MSSLWSPSFWTSASQTSLCNSVNCLALLPFFPQYEWWSRVKEELPISETRTHWPYGAGNFPSPARKAPDCSILFLRWISVNTCPSMGQQLIPTSRMMGPFTTLGIALEKTLLLPITLYGSLLFRQVRPPHLCVNGNNLVLAITFLSFKLALSSSYLF